MTHIGTDTRRVIWRQGGKGALTARFAAVRAPAAPVSALDPADLTQVWLRMPFRRGVSASQGCHFDFARRVTFLPCADNP